MFLRARDRIRRLGRHRDPRAAATAHRIRETEWIDVESFPLLAGYRTAVLSSISIKQRGHSFDVTGNDPDRQPRFDAAILDVDETRATLVDEIVAIFVFEA